MDWNTTDEPLATATVTVCCVLAPTLVSVNAGAEIVSALCAAAMPHSESSAVIPVNRIVFRLR
jgi:hypothetical protein